MPLLYRHLPLTRNFRTVLHTGTFLFLHSSTYNMISNVNSNICWRPGPRKSCAKVCKLREDCTWTNPSFVTKYDISVSPVKKHVHASMFSDKLKTTWLPIACQYLSTYKGCRWMYVKKNKTTAEPNECHLLRSEMSGKPISHKGLGAWVSLGAQSAGLAVFLVAIIITWPFLCVRCEFTTLHSHHDA